MNLPNKLTIFRIILIPICLWLLFADYVPYHYFFAMLAFIIASVTDTLDGRIARKYNLVTDFGKFMDPLADKMLVCSILICFIDLGFAHSIAIVCIIFREFAISSLRLVALSNGKVVAANIWGKIKTTVQMVAIVGMLFFAGLADCGAISGGDGLMLAFNLASWVMAGVTVISGVTYISANRHFLKP